MAEEKKKEEVKKEEKKGFFGKLKEHAADKEEQLEILSTFVRLGILVWSGAILTLAYVELPSALKIPKQDLDPTFIASVFTECYSQLLAYKHPRKVHKVVVPVVEYQKQIWRS